MNLKSIAIIGLLIGSSIDAKELKQVPILSSTDFTHVEEVTKKGKSVLKVELTLSGAEKLNSINQKGLGEKIRLKVGKKMFHFKLNEKITGDKLILGPFSRSEALKIKKEINHYS